MPSPNESSTRRAPLVLAVAMLSAALACLGVVAAAPGPSPEPVLLLGVTPESAQHAYRMKLRDFLAPPAPGLTSLPRRLSFPLWLGQASGLFSEKETRAFTEAAFFNPAASRHGWHLRALILRLDGVYTGTGELLVPLTGGIAAKDAFRGPVLHKAEQWYEATRAWERETGEDLGRQRILLAADPALPSATLGQVIRSAHRASFDDFHLLVSDRSAQRKPPPALAERRRSLNRADTRFLHVDLPPEGSSDIEDADCAQVSARGVSAGTIVNALDALAAAGAEVSDVQFWGDADEPASVAATPSMGTLRLEKPVATLLISAGRISVTSCPPPGVMGVCRPDEPEPIAGECNCLVSFCHSGAVFGDSVGHLSLDEALLELSRPLPVERSVPDAGTPTPEGEFGVQRDALVVEPESATDAVEKTLRKYQGQVKYCAEAFARSAEPPCPDSVHVGFQINQGRVVSTNVSEDAERLTECTASKVRRWRFPSDVEADIDVSYRFDWTGTPCGAE